MSSAASAATAVVAEKMKSRDAYRAIYMASPLKFCTSLSPFDMVVPRFYIGSWHSDPHAFHRWKRRKFIERKRGRFTYTRGPLAGVREPGWPDPGLLTEGDIAAVARQASEQRLDSLPFWQELAERTRSLRDVIRIADLVAILDALVTVNHRHVDLMRTLTRELIDDVDKLSFLEVATVAHAYGHFRCHNQGLLTALANQAISISQSESVAEDIDEDPRALGILAKAFRSLSFGTPQLFSMLKAEVVPRAAILPLLDTAEVLEYFVAMKEPFEASADYWTALSDQAPRSSLKALSHTLCALGKLRVEVPPSCRSSFVAAGAAILREEAAGVARSSPSSPSKDSPSAAERNMLLEKLPAFSKPPAPRQLLLMPFAVQEEQQQRRQSTTEANSNQMIMAEVFANGSGGSRSSQHIEQPHDGHMRTLDEADSSSAQLEQQQDAQLSEGLDFEEMEVLDEEASVKPPHLLRWYNASLRRPFGAASGRGYGSFSTREISRRNRLGAEVATLLEALNDQWAGQEVGDIPWQESDMAQLASPIVLATVQGMSSGQLVACADAYAILHDVVRQQKEVQQQQQQQQQQQRQQQQEVQQQVVPPDGPARHSQANSQVSDGPQTQLATPDEQMHLGSQGHEISTDLPLQIMQGIVREAVRKLSNFTVPQLRRLHEAARRVGVQDLYLMRARYRRYPKEYRRELHAIKVAQIRGGGVEEGARSSTLVE